MDKLTPHTVINSTPMTDDVRRQIEKYRKEYISFHSLKSIETDILSNINFTIEQRMRIFYEVAAYLFGVDDADDALARIVNYYNSESYAMGVMYGK